MESKQHVKCQSHSTYNSSLLRSRSLPAQSITSDPGKRSQSSILLDGLSKSTKIFKNLIPSFSPKGLSELPHPRRSRSVHQQIESKNTEQTLSIMTNQTELNEGEQQNSKFTRASGVVVNKENTKVHHDLKGADTGVLRKPVQEKDASTKKLELYIQEQKQMIDEQNKRMQSYQKEKEEVKQKYNDMEQELKETSCILETKQEQIKRLQEQISNDTPKSTKTIYCSDLSQPQREILELWRNLGYDIQNFVMNYFRDPSERKMMNWAESQMPLLKQITPHYSAVIKEKNYGSRLVEAAIWEVLMQRVFGHSYTSKPCLWAGRFSSEISHLNDALFQIVDSNSSEKQRSFYQWKVQTTCLMAKLESNSMREISEAPCVDELDKLLRPLGSKATNFESVNWGLNAIVRKAVDLDQILCGQLAWYNPMYPSKRYDFPLDRSKVNVMDDFPLFRVVAFVVRPYLCQFSGELGELYNAAQILEQCFVCARAGFTAKSSMMQK